MAGKSLRRFTAAAAPQGSAGLTAPLRSITGHEDGANWWVVTLSDLTLLLLGFLVCWYVTRNPAPAPSSGVAAETSAAQKPSITTPAIGELSLESWQAMQRDLSDFIARARLGDAVTIESSAREIVLSLRETVPFASGKATLRAQALPILEKVVAVVIGEPSLAVAISGHTDSLRIATVEFPSNWELSAARASRVARYLVERGVHPARIAVQGYADHRPRRPNSTAVNRSMNRRVEIRLFQDSAATNRDAVMESTSQQ